MVTLYIDTCNRFLGVGLEIDGTLVYKKEYDAFKRQSELLAKEVDECLKINKVNPKDLNRIVVTNGPGSYTGIRIGLTFAKVMASSLNIELVLVSSLLSMAGKGKNMLALIDAKGKRAYYGVYSEGRVIKEDSVEYLDKIDLNNYTLVGDTYLFNKENREYSVIENTYELRDLLKPCVDSRLAKAIYLKD